MGWGRAAVGWGWRRVGQEGVFRKGWVRIGGGSFYIFDSKLIGQISGIFTFTSFATSISLVYAVLYNKNYHIKLITLS